MYQNRTENQAEILNLNELKLKRIWFEKRPSITYGYRSNMGYLKSTKSICMVHNETFNFWSHFVSFMYGLLNLYKLWTHQF